MFMHFHTYIPILFLSFDTKLFGAFLRLSLSLSLSLSLVLVLVCSMAPKCKSTPSQNPLHSRAFSSDPTPSHVWFRDEKAKSNFKENFSQCGIHSERLAKSFYQIFPILTFPLSSTVVVRSHCVASQSLVPPWSYMSFTLICTDLILQYLILLLAFKVRAS